MRKSKRGMAFRVRPCSALNYSLTGCGFSSSQGKRGSTTPGSIKSYAEISCSHLMFHIHHWESIGSTSFIHRWTHGSVRRSDSSKILHVLGSFFPNRLFPSLTCVVLPDSSFEPREGLLRKRHSGLLMTPMQ